MFPEPPKPTPTPHVMKLADALMSKGVDCKIEWFDGHKHVDIYIPSAKLIIEVNGLQHYTDPWTIFSDLKRAHYSDGDDRDTLTITNQLIDSKLDEISEGILGVVNKLSGTE